MNKPLRFKSPAAERTYLRDMYNKHAVKLAQKFAGIGPRTEDIDRAFSFLNKRGPVRVLELGCAAGRDIPDILRHTPHYTGMDMSSKMIALARQAHPRLHFVVGDMMSKRFPQKNDIVFAFASLLHCPREDVEFILARAAEALTAHGIFYVSLKKRPYEREVQKGKLSRSIFYFYEPKDIAQLAGDRYDVIYKDVQVKQGIPWFTMALRKK